MSRAEKPAPAPGPEPLHAPDDTNPNPRNTTGQGERRETSMDWQQPATHGLPPREQAAVFIAANMGDGERMAIAGGEVAFLTRSCPTTDSVNEDAVAVIPVHVSTGVLVLADGCGGQANGQAASQIAIESLVESLCACDPAIGLRAPILDGFELAMQRVRTLGNGAATTLLVVELNQGMLRSYHVGDSQALIVGGHGKIKLQTQAHSPVGYALDAGILTERAAMHHEDRHLVSNVIGADDTHIAVGSPRLLAQRDTVVLGSDGLFDNLRIDEIAQLARKGDLKTCLTNICHLVSDRMLTTGADIAAETPSKPDDISVMLYRLK